MEKIIFLFALAVLNVFASASDSDVASALSEAGIAHAAKGNTVQATDALYRAIALDPKCWKALFALAKICEKDGSKIEAAILYQKAFICSTDSSVRSQSEARYRALNPLAAKLADLFKDYARSVESISRSRSIDSLTEKCSERISDLKLDDFLSKDQMPRLSSGNTVNLLHLIRSTPGLLPSGWDRRETCIISPSSGVCKIQIPYKPTDSYQFSVSFKRIDADGTVGILVPTKSGVTQLWYHEKNRMNMPGKQVILPPATKIGDTCSLSLKVTGTHMEAYFNGKMLCVSDTPAPAPEWLLEDPSCLGFGTKNCRAEITSITVSSIIGNGAIK